MAEKSLKSAIGEANYDSLTSRVPALCVFLREDYKGCLRADDTRPETASPALLFAVLLHAASLSYCDMDESMRQRESEAPMR